MIRHAEIILEFGLDRSGFAAEAYSNFDQRRPKARPHVPEKFKEIVCSDKPLADKRVAIEEAIASSEHFIAWVLLIMHYLELTLENENIGHRGLGFSAWDGRLFREMAQHLFERGYLCMDEIMYCQRLRRRKRRQTWCR